MSFRFALKPFIDYPERYPKEVLFFDSNVSIIWDKYPKSSIHLLILPRDLKMTRLTPIKAFDDLKFKESLEMYINMAIELVEKEFKKKWKSKSNDDEDDDEDNNRINIKVLCHAIPSLNNLHIHVLTDDFYSPCLKNKKHFNSFQEPFGIKFENFPIGSQDEIKDPTFAEHKLRDGLNWRGKNYGPRFAKLKTDLNSDFESKWERIS